MAKRPNVSPSGWLSNLGNQPRLQQSLANRQQLWIKSHSWLFQQHGTTKITRDQWDAASELQIIHMLDPSNQKRP